MFRYTPIKIFLTRVPHALRGNCLGRTARALHSQISQKNYEKKMLEKDMDMLRDRVLDLKRDFTQNLNMVEDTMFRIEGKVADLEENIDNIADLLHSLQKRNVIEREFTRDKPVTSVKDYSDLITNNFRI